MSLKIGEALIERGVITPKQLERALQMQLIFGGHLGTCLIELGFTDETTLGITLAEVLKMKRAPAEAFEDIPAEVLKTIPQRLAQKLSVVPFGLEGRELHIAGIHSRSMSTLSSITGFKIRPYVAPEIRIVQALERYYGIAPRRRFVKLSCEVGPPTGLSKPEPGIPLSVVGPDPFQSHASRFDPEPAVAGAQGDMDPVLALSALSRQMSRVLSHAQLADVILEYAAERMQRCVLFEVQGGEATARRWCGDDLDDTVLDRLVVPVTTDSIFALVLEDSYYRGPVPDGPDSEAFYDAMGVSAPREMMILPIYGDDHLEVILYGDGGRVGHIDGGIESHLLLSENIALAMKMLSFKIQLNPG